MGTGQQAKEMVEGPGALQASPESGNRITWKSLLLHEAPERTTRSFFLRGLCKEQCQTGNESSITGRRFQAVGQLVPGSAGACTTAVTQQPQGLVWCSWNGQPGAKGQAGCSQNRGNDPSLGSSAERVAVALRFVRARYRVGKRPGGTHPPTHPMSSLVAQIGGFGGLCCLRTLTLLPSKPLEGFMKNRCWWRGEGGIELPSPPNPPCRSRPRKDQLG